MELDHIGLRLHRHQEVPRIMAIVLALLGLHFLRQLQGTVLIAS